MVIQLLFVSGCKKKEVPSLITSEIKNITGTSATCGGDITDEGSGTVIERGICWSKGINPTVADKKTIEGGGAGQFVSNMDNLDAATTYFVRAYASNEAGTGYGMGMSFKTLGQAPIANTKPATYITSNTATLNSIINANDLATTVSFDYGPTDKYGKSVTSNQNPFTGNKNTNVSIDISGLSIGTNYHFRVKTENSLGTVYGNDMTFTTVGLIIDNDGNVYQPVTIGRQVWMKENLKTTKYVNGDPITEITDATQWNNLKTGAYCNYDNNMNTANTYGRLYNWYAVNDNRKICPAGWHVPYDSDWTILTNYLGGENIAGGKLKEAGTTHWISPNLNATNETGFTALPGGRRLSFPDETCHFIEIGENGYWWSAVTAANLAWYRSMLYKYGFVNRNGHHWRTGHSIRCIKD